MIDRKEAADAKKKNYPMVPGEYLPWKGFMFQVTEVTDSGFKAEVRGVTKKLAHLAPKKENANAR